MNRLPLAFAASAAVAFISGCESTTSPSAPPVTAAMVQAGVAQHADTATLAAGRTIFLARCAHCHALPVVAEHTAQQWPKIVAQMAKRSGLKPADRQAVLAYLLAARTQ